MYNPFRRRRNRAKQRKKNTDKGASFLTRVSKTLDRGISVIAPKWGFERDRYRKAQAYADSFETTQSNRLNKSRNHIGGTGADHHDASTLHTARESSRHVDRTNAIATGLRETMVDNIVGPEITVQARSGDTDWDKRAEEWWKESYAPGYCDFTGGFNFTDQARNVFSCFFRDGDHFPNLVHGRIQQIEADYILTPRDYANDPTVINGVKVNRYGQAQGYFVAKEHPTHRYAGPFSYVRAENMIHVWRKDRPSATRTMPQVTPILNHLDRLEDYIDATIIAAEMAACLSVFIEKENMGSGDPGTQGTNPKTGETENVEELEPGMIKYLRRGEKISQVAPAHPGAGFEALVRSLYQICGRRWGLPIELAMMNFEKSNFSNTRAALLFAYRTFQGWQHWFKYQYLRRVWRYSVSYAMLSGALARPTVAGADPLRHEWMLPGWQWVDPLKDMKADLMAIEANINSKRRVCGKYGLDSDEIREERKREIAAERGMNPEDTPEPKEAA